MAAGAVLVTHQHADHIDQQLVAAAGVKVIAPSGAQLDIAYTAVEIDSAVQFAGFDVEPVGGRHACVVEHQEPCVNVGCVINGAHHHPGDALHVPEGPIETLFVPLQASWLKTAEAIDFVNRVAPRRAIGIHEGQINERGLAAINYWMSKECDGVYEWLPPGTATELDLLP